MTPPESRMSLGKKRPTSIRPNKKRTTTFLDMKEESLTTPLIKMLQDKIIPIVSR